MVEGLIEWVSSEFMRFTMGVSCLAMELGHDLCQIYPVYLVLRCVYRVWDVRDGQ